MPRKTVDKMNGPDSREAVWAAIRRLQAFTVRELNMETNMNVKSVRDYVTGLAAAGYLEKAGAESTGAANVGNTAIRWKLVRDIGVDAPRVRKDGTMVIQGRGRQQMWRTMRIIGTFSVLDLAVTASTEDCLIAEATAEEYIKFLRLAGYLKKVKGGYRLLPGRYTGPKAPMIQRVKQVWDQNIKQVMWSSRNKEVDKP
jgi:hypothetical protein